MTSTNPFLQPGPDGADRDELGVGGLRFSSPPAGGPARSKNGLARTLAQLVAVAAALGVAVAALALQPALAGGAVVNTAAKYLDQLPSRILEPPQPSRSVLLDATGRKFATISSYNRIPITAEAMSPWIRQAVVTVEDNRFYTHRGFDPVGIARAAWSNFNGDTTLQGASTITQQYVKNVLTLAAELGADDEAARTGKAVSLERKLREVKLATALEREHSKDEILTKYLNIAYFGAGAYGVEAAANRYFSVPAAKLTLTQAATLVPLLKNPTRYNPLTYPKKSLERRNLVLGELAEAGIITPHRAEQAAAQPLGLRPAQPRAGCHASKYPFYCAQVLATLKNDPAFGKTAAERARLLAVGGLRIHTALNPHAQEAADAAARSTIPADHSVAAALAVVRPGTGEVAALGTNRFYGSSDPGQTEILLPAKPAFQPGSTFKVFTLAAAFDKGFPLSTRVPGGATYTSKVLNNPPKGYYSNSAGSVTNPDLTRATQMSMNTAYVQLEERVGVLAVAEMANRLGVKSVTATGKGAPSPRDGSFTLGTASVSPLEMTTAYATIAAHGRYCPPKLINRITDRAGKVVVKPADRCTQVIDSAAADTIAHVLGTVISHGTGRPADFGRPAAGKTGTTENLGAAWFAGFTPQYATAVWVGDPRGGAAHPLYNVLGHSRVYGGTLPATVWRKTMTQLHQGLPVVPLPAPDPSYVAATAGDLIPHVVGLGFRQAVDRVKAAGAAKVTIKRVPRPRGLGTGVVLAQNPGADQRAPGAKVVLEVTGD